jgi:hypothetical protein
MDVVKSETAAVGGRISVTTEAGQGTTFRIHLPLTLAVTQALLVRAGGRTFAIPSSMVAQVLELKPRPRGSPPDEQGHRMARRAFNYRYLPRLLGDHESQAQAERFNWVLLLRAAAKPWRSMWTRCVATRKSSSRTPARSYARMVGYERRHRAWRRRDRADPQPGRAGWPQPGGQRRPAGNAAGPRAARHPDGDGGR